MKITKSKYEGIFLVENGKKKIATINLVPGYTPFSEQTVKQDGKEYRIWNPHRSKWAAAIMKNIKKFSLKKGDNVLYLGAASGQSASYISDIVGKEGKVFCIDIAPRVMRDLIFVAEKKENMVPILADATNPKEYEFIGKVDFIFQDVAMPNQVEILKRNAHFLKDGGQILLAVKSRSIDVTAKPSDIFAKVEHQLAKDFDIIDKKRLEPYEMDHIVFLLSKKVK